jgi:hypothetical protein
MTSLTVYLDTNIFSRVTDMMICDETALAYRQLAAMPELVLVTSAKTKQELERTPNEKRASLLLFVLASFAKVPWKVAEYDGTTNGAPLGMTTLNGEWTHPDLAKLIDIFDADDAMHIFQASQAGCHYFLTLDEKSILSRARRSRALLFSICPQLKFCSPIELIAELAPHANG